MANAIWFDMDGTIANLYGDEKWLEKILNEDATLYANAKPLVKMTSLARLLNRLQRNGYEIGIVSWLAKGSSKNYDTAVTAAKRKWLKTHLKSVNFNHIDIIGYGEPKENGRNGILFDDEELNRRNWNGTAYNVNKILPTLKGLLKCQKRILRKKKEKSALRGKDIIREKLQPHGKKKYEILKNTKSDSKTESFARAQSSQKVHI